MVSQSSFVGFCGGFTGFYRVHSSQGLARLDRVV